MKPQDKGQKFEQYIAKLFKDMGKRNVKHNQRKKKRLLGKKDLNFQIDITYGLIKKYYIECKYKEKNSVSLEEVAKFKSVLDMLNIPNNRGILITNQHYNQRAEHYAKQQGITTYNREQLIKLDKKRKSIFKRIKERKNYNLETQILAT